MIVTTANYVLHFKICMYITENIVETVKHDKRIKKYTPIGAMNAIRVNARRLAVDHCYRNDIHTLSVVVNFVEKRLEQIETQY